MSALLALLILAGALWFVISFAGARVGAGREPIDSISEFARAMHALDPDGRPPRRAPSRR